MFLTLEALCVDLVDILGARGAGGEPSFFRYDLQASYGSVVARSTREPGNDWLTGQGRGADVIGRDASEAGLLLGRGR